MSSSGVRMPLTTRLLSRRLSRLKLRYAASSVPGTSGMAATPQLTRRNSITSGFRKHSKCGALGWQPDKHGLNSPNEFSYRGINVGSQNCLRFWKELDVPMEETPFVPSGSEKNFFKIGAGIEHITGGTIWLLVRRVSELPGLGCYELMQLAGPQYPTGILVLPDHFDHSV